MQQAFFPVCLEIVRLLWLFYVSDGKACVAPLPPTKHTHPVIVSMFVCVCWDSTPVIFQPKGSFVFQYDVIFLYSAKNGLTHGCAIHPSIPLNNIYMQTCSLFLTLQN